MELQDWVSDSVDDIEEERDPVLSFIQEQPLQEGWKYLSSREIADSFSLSYEPMDGNLLATAKVEMMAVCQNARNLMNNGTSDVSLSDCINYFLDSIADDLFKTVAAGMPSGHQPSGADVAEFIKVLSLLSVYKTTPDTFFDSRNVNLFPISLQYSQNKFNTILKALKTRRASNENCLSWGAAFCTDTDIREAERRFTRVASRIAFIRKVSVLSIDDDHYRVKSVLTEEMGFARFNNPKKAFGPVSTNAVSLTTSIVLGMRLAGRGESFGDVVQVCCVIMFVNAY
jgi:hypothetical protein